MRIVFVVIFILQSLNCAYAQDERFFRKIFSGDVEVKDKPVEKHYSYTLHTPEYLIDLNQDNAKESVVFVKRDSEDWIEIFDQYKQRIFQYRFEEKGLNSGLFRLVRKKLSNQSMILALYYFEGETNYLNFESSARVYLLTIDNNDLKTISVFKGPSFFEEYKSLKSHYHLRSYDVSIADLNQDKSREVIVKYRNNSLVYIYRGNGKWITYNR